LRCLAEKKAEPQCRFSRHWTFPFDDVIYPHGRDADRLGKPGLGKSEFIQ
jgi:hypothetical protein